MKIDFVSTTFLSSLYRIYALLLTSFWNEFVIQTSPTEFRPSFKRLFVFLVLFWVLPLFVCWQHLGFFLDDYIFFPQALSSTSVPSPVFIVSNARSGSTVFHRQLCESLPQPASFTLFEILFAQSVTFRTLFHFLYRYLPPLRFVLDSLDVQFMRWSEARFLHPFSLFTHPEEDEWAMTSFGACQLLGLFFPSVSSRLIDFDRECSQEEQNALWNAYFNLVQRKCFFHHHVLKHTRIVFVAKNPTFTLRLASLVRAFPDAKVIHLVRDPQFAIPSMVSYIANWWKVMATAKKEFPHAEALQTMCVHHYVYPSQVLSQYCVVFHEKVDWNHVATFLSVKLVPPRARREATTTPILHHQYSLDSVLHQTQEEFQEKHKAIYQAFPQYKI